MVVKTAGKTVDAVKTAADVVKEHVDKVAEKIDKVEEIISDKKDEKPEEKPAKAVEAPVEEIDKSEFEEGIGAKSEPASLSVDNFLERLDQVKDLDKPAFIKANYALFEAAMRKAGR